jgi:hypothetical protein
MWNSSNDAKKNCAAYEYEYNKTHGSIQLIKCNAKLSFICKVGFFLTIRSFFQAICFWQIEISFPGSCFNPPYTQKQDSNFEASARQQMVSSAIDIQEDIGVPFYFKCDGKQYMAIMAPVNFTRIVIYIL